jgi:hypothetical protein
MQNTRWLQWYQKLICGKQCDKFGQNVRAHLCDKRGLTWAYRLLEEN